MFGKLSISLYLLSPESKLLSRIRKEKKKEKEKETGLNCQESQEHAKFRFPQTFIHRLLPMAQLFDRNCEDVSAQIAMMNVGMEFGIASSNENFQCNHELCRYARKQEICTQLNQPIKTISHNQIWICTPPHPNLTQKTWNHRRENEPPNSN